MWLIETLLLEPFRRTGRWELPLIVASLALSVASCVVVARYGLAAVRAVDPSLVALLAAIIVYALVAIAPSVWLSIWWDKRDERLGHTVNGYRTTVFGSTPKEQT